MGRTRPACAPAMVTALAALAVLVACGSSAAPRAPAVSPSPTPSTPPPASAPPASTSPTGTPAPSAAATGVLRGLTQAAPTCPVERIGMTCTAPVSARVTVADAAGDRMAEVVSGPDGAFQLSLAPGLYTVTAELPGPRPMSRSASVRVVAGAVQRVTLTFDTGIR